MTRAASNAGRRALLLLAAVLIAVIGVFALSGAPQVAGYLFPATPKYRVLLELPTGYCDGFTVFFDPDENNNAADTGEQLRIAVPAGDRGAILRLGRDVGIDFATRDAPEGTEPEFRVSRVWSNATDYEIRPPGDPCGDQIKWDGDAANPTRYLEEIYQQLSNR